MSETAVRLPGNSPDSLDVKAWQDVLASVYDNGTGVSPVVVVDGYAASVRVASGSLVVTDGAGRRKRQRVIERSNRTVKRIVVLSRAGTVTFDALRWVTELGISLSVVTSDGTVTAATAQPTAHDARLRRAQALSAGTVVGNRVASSLIAWKIRGHAETLEALGHESATALRESADAVEGGSVADLDRLREVEAACASLYFTALTERVTVQFASRDASRVPSRWSRVQQRKSPLGNLSSPRAAADPFNALLNYAYALGETITSQACHIVGLDPALGVMHTDKRNRDSMALDILEVLRPIIDRDVMRLVESRRFRKVDFIETAKGQCRLTESVTHTLTECMPSWAAAIGPVVEWVSHEIGDTSTLAIRKRTPLTQQTRLDARISVTPKRGGKPVTAPTVKPTCRVCGAQLTERRRKLCSTCWVMERERLAVERAAKGREARRLAIAAGSDPTQTDAAREARREGLRRERAERDRWDAEHLGEVFDREAFTREIVPGLSGVPLSVIVTATGVGDSAASRIRRGMLVPHARHWAALTALVDALDV